jgi:glycosyltransferase involved in cell wall biosynthesis
MKKRVLILGKLPPPYIGPAVATRIILNSPLKERYSLFHLDTRLNRAVADIGRWSLAKPFKSMAIYVKLAWLLLRHRPHLVLVPISQSTPGFIKDSVYILMARFLGRRVLLHLRGSNLKNWLNGSSRITRAYVSWVIRRAAGAIVLGRRLRYLFADYFPEERIFVVPNGGNFDFPSGGKNSNDFFRILFFSNLLSSKGIEDVIEAVSLLKCRLKDSFMLEAVGQWVNEGLKKTVLAKVEIERLPVKFYPPKSGREKAGFFSGADVFVFPPRKPEGHPWVIVEALAAGLPIIATDQGAIVESVQDGLNGFIVEPRKPEQISEKLSLLYKDSELRKRMGASSSRNYLENFTEEKMVERLAAAFQEVIDS